MLISTTVPSCGIQLGLTVGAFNIGAHSRVFPLMALQESCEAKEHQQRLDIVPAAVKFLVAFQYFLWYCVLLQGGEAHERTTENTVLESLQTI